VAAAAEAHAKAASQAQAVGAEQARSAAEAQTSAAALAGERARLVEARLGALEQAAGHGASRVAALQVAQVLQERRISTVLEAVRRQPEPSGEPAARVVDREQEHLLDPMYAEFEDAWRGTREAIKERARASMLAPVRAAGAGTLDRPLLDLGCGRGEWLELLAEEGLVGRGIDLNRVFIQQCQERHLAVEEADALAHLRSLPDACLGAVTAIHLLEHLPFSMLVAILDETVRVLKPGGIAVFETPNPTNLAVGASDFYRDPTHRNPLHPETMQFLAERRGLVRVAVLPLHPAPMEQRVLEDGTALPRWINEHFRGPRDYALVGYRA
jgi:O-antigen chain-terminating methyltransferase